MDTEEIKKHCLGKHGAYETQPFGDVPICYKLNNKIFAQLYPYEHDYKITLKCTAEQEGSNILGLPFRGKSFGRNRPHQQCILV